MKYNIVYKVDRCTNSQVNLITGLLSKMKQSIDKTEFTGNEYGFYFTKNKKRNTLKALKIMPGTPNGVYIGSPPTRSFGSFHTHVDHYTQLSTIDVAHALFVKEPFSCLGCLGRKHYIIKVWKWDYDNIKLIKNITKAFSLDPSSTNFKTLAHQVQKQALACILHVKQLRKESGGDEKYKKETTKRKWAQ